MAVIDGYFDGDADFVSQEQEDRDYALGARYDYMAEAYGDRCPRHPGVLRGGGDCWRCEQAAYDTPATFVGYAFKALPVEERDTVKFFARQGLVMVVAGVVRLTRKGQTDAARRDAERMAELEAA